MSGNAVFVVGTSWWLVGTLFGDTCVWSAIGDCATTVLGLFNKRVFTLLA